MEVGGCLKGSSRQLHVGRDRASLEHWAIKIRGSG